MAQIDWNERLRDYFERYDFWDEDVDIYEIERLELSESIKLKHAYIILSYLKESTKKFEENIQIIEENKIYSNKFFGKQENQSNKKIIKTSKKGKVFLN